MEQQQTSLGIPQAHYDQLLCHLLRKEGCEEAAFVFCNCNQDDGATEFQFIEWLPVPVDGFVARSPYYLELTDETRAQVIKRAHDLGASFQASPSLVGDWILLLSEEGTMYRVKAARTFEEGGQSKLGETTKASPAFMDGRIYIRGDEHLYCIGKE